EERPEPDESDVALGDDVDRNLPQVGFEPALAREASAKIRSRQMIDEARHDAAGDIDAAAGAEGQRKVAADRAEHRAEHVECRPTRRAAAIKRGLRDRGRVARGRAGTVDGVQGIVEIDETGPG